MGYDVEVKWNDPAPIAVVRRRAAQRDFSVVVPAACGEVWAALKAARVENPGRHVAVYYPGDGLDDRIPIEVGAEVSQPFAGAGPVVGSATPGGTVATTTHMGPYGRLGDAHSAILAWCAANQRVPEGTNWEIYGHWDDDWTDDPARIRTDVVYLLRDDAGPAA